MARETFNDDQEIGGAERRLGIGRPRKGESLARYMARAARPPSRRKGETAAQYQERAARKASAPASLVERVYQGYHVRGLAAQDLPLGGRGPDGRFRHVTDAERRTYAAEVAKRLRVNVGGIDGEKVVIGRAAFDPVAAPRIRLLRAAEHEAKVALDRARASGGGRRGSLEKAEHDRMRQARLRWEKNGPPTSYTASRLPDPRGERTRAQMAKEARRRERRAG